MTAPEPGYYKHYNGGYYRLICVGRDKATRNSRAVYEHVWPGQHQIWVRPLPEFVEKFTPVSNEEMTYIMSGDRYELRRG